MNWRRSVNGVLRRATGYELHHADAYRIRQPRPERPAAGEPAEHDRLVTAPTFIICSLRSGSTLLRVLLDSHSQIHSPHELHLRYIDVRFASKWAARAMGARGLNTTGLEYLLWDRILHRDLTLSGKERIVCKTPNDVFNVDRIRECWPDARFIFLLRHPAAIARSRASLRPTVDEEKNVKRILQYCQALEKARRAYEGHTVRYEDLTSDPAGVTQGICEFLGVPWEPEMLEYGRFDHGRYGAGLGDWKAKIKTGRIQAPEPLPAPEDVPPQLRKIAAAWGYAPRDEAPAVAAGSEAGAARPA